MRKSNSTSKIRFFINSILIISLLITPNVWADGYGFVREGALTSSDKFFRGTWGGKHYVDEYSFFISENDLENLKRLEFSLSSVEFNTRLIVISPSQRVFKDDTGYNSFLKIRKRSLERGKWIISTTSTRKRGFGRYTLEIESIERNNRKSGRVVAAIVTSGVIYCVVVGACLDE